MNIVAAGRVTSVDSKSVGSPVVGAATAGDQSLFVNNDADFSPGDQVLITPLDGTGELYVVGSVDDASGITLTSPLMEDAPEGTWVAVYPLQYETIATVRLVDTGEVRDCVVLHTLADALRPGIRDEDTSEGVLTVKVDGVRYVFDVIARQTIRDVSDALPGVPPAQPDAPILTTLAYLDSMKQLRAQISATWSPVTLNEDGSDISDLDHYEVQTKGATGDWQTYTSTPGDITQAFIRNLEPESEWSVRLRAVDTSKNASAWSDSTTITAAADSIAPSTPSRPVLTSRLGVITITWDGKNSVAAAMEDDLAYVEVHLSTSTGFTPSASTKVDQMAGAASVVWGPATFGTTYYVKFVAVDTSGNSSAASLQQSTDVKALVDVSNFPDSAMEVLYARTAHFITLDADQVTSNSAAIGFLETGIITSAIFEAKTGGEFRTFTPDPAHPTNPPSGGGIRIRDSDGFKAWANGGGTPTVTIDRTTGIITARGGDFQDGDISGTNITGGSLTIGSTFSVEAGSVDIDADATTISGSLLSIFASASILNDLDVGGGVTITGTLDVNAFSQFTGGVTVDGLFSSGTITGAGDVNANDGFFDVSLVGGGTTGASINDNGKILRTSPSSRRFKTEIEPLDIAPDAVRAIHGVSFVYKDPEKHGAGRQVGLLAEDLVAAGLGDFVTRDSAGEITGILYDRLVVAVLPLISDLNARIEALEAP